ncbi:LuxR family transcriptional regulator [Gordonibacter sp. An230]|uniref:LuxR family transcriptional regulator n=1 Tax=Gordonibacter sp. An230 TaxID=1965592 RepID=UPI0013A660E9|nr:LuxR family transcriptional regulator [Gordonibacter sp. An230]
MEAGIVERMAALRRHLKAVTLADVFDVRALGFALTLAWASIVFFSTTVHFSTRNDVSHFNSVVGFSSVGMLAVLLPAALGPKRFARAMRAPIMRALAPAVMSVSTVVLVVIDLNFFTQPWCSLSSMAAGAGLGVLYLAWGEEFRRLAPTQAVVETASSFMLAALLFALVVALPRPVGVVATVLLPLAVGLVVLARGVWKDAAEPASAPAPLRRGAFSVRALLSLGVLSFAESFIRALFFNASPIISEGSYPWLFLVATMASIAFVCVPLFSADGLDVAAAYRAAVLALGFMFLLLPILDLGSLPADIVALTMYATVTLLVWIVLVRITGLFGLVAPFSFGVGWGAHVAGSLAGTFGGALLGSFIELAPRVLSVVELGCVCLLFLAYLFLFTDRSMTSLLGVRPDSRRRPFRERCERVAREYSLTPREQEIMALVAKGRSTPRIQKALGLTAGTVNTHLAHLYRKLDVHDKQEIIDLLERPQAKSEQ